MTSPTGPRRNRSPSPLPLSPRGRGIKGEGAFTLVELLVVLAVMGALAAATMPALRRSVGETRLRGAARELVATLSLARDAAAATGRTQTIAVPGRRPLPGGVRLAENSDQAAVFGPGGLAQPARFILEIPARDSRVAVEVTRFGRVRVVAL